MSTVLQETQQEMAGLQSDRSALVTEAPTATVPSLVSIVISIYSEKRFDDLVELLDRINGQSYGKHEAVIIVDENEPLYFRIMSHVTQKNYYDVNVVFNPENKGLSYSRNLGIKNAIGEYVAFIDDDAVPELTWVESLVNSFAPDVGAVAGHIVPGWENVAMAWFPKELFWMISCSYNMTPDQKGEVERGFGVNMVFRKDLFHKLGDFNEKLGINGKKWLGGEDSDMFLRVRESQWKVVYAPDAKVIHKIPGDRITFRKIIKRSLAAGTSIVAMKRYRQYAIKNSTESSYLKKIVFEFYPSTMIQFLGSCKKLVKQISAVSITVAFVGIGYIYGTLKHEH
jgi:glucosyl-dolichyl phosphate glucuronosyltransferase